MPKFAGNMVLGLIVGGVDEILNKGNHSKELKDAFKKYYLIQLKRGGDGDLIM